MNKYRTLEEPLENKYKVSQVYINISREVLMSLVINRSAVSSAVTLILYFNIQIRISKKIDKTNLWISKMVKN